MGPEKDIPRAGKMVTFSEDYCFVCGRRNPIGLKLEFDLDKENRRATNVVSFSVEHQGWDGVVHGGIIAAVLDDVMAYAIMTTGNMGITTRMSIAYRKPIGVGEEIHLEGEVVKLTARTAVARGIAYTMNGSERVLKAEAEGTYYLDRPKGDDREWANRKPEDRKRTDR